MMKRYYIGLCTLLMLLCVSCDLDYAPENTLVDEKVYRTERTTEAALMGCYVRLNIFLAGAPKDQNNYANLGYTYLMGDLGTENLKARSSFSSYLAMENSQYGSSEHDGVLREMWYYGYNAIDFTNNVIVGVEKYAKYDEKKKRQYIAEAKFVRAYVYFYLLTIFGDQAILGNDAGDGLVVRLLPYNGYNPDEIQGRSSNASCWAQIIKDLTDALPDLPVTVPAAAERIRANRSVAEALLSRVYLYKGTFLNNIEELTSARDYAKNVLQAQGYVFSSSSDEFKNALFPRNEYTQSGSYPDPTTRSNELIFYEPSRLYTDNYPNGLYYYQKRYYFIPQERLALYEPDDVRLTYLIGMGSSSDSPNDVTCMKYSGGSQDDVIYIRLAEMKLTYAEALTRVADAVMDEAVGQLNDIRQRAFPDGKKPPLYAVSDFASVEDFLKELLRERNRELAYEGHYRWDLVRTNNLLSDTRLGAMEPACWNVPVPDYEIRISYGAIEQNSGYTE